MSIRTVIVLSALSETTTPWRVFCRPGPRSRGGVVCAIAAALARLLARPRALRAPERAPSCAARRRGRRGAPRACAACAPAAFAALPARARRRRSLGATTSCGLRSESARSCVVRARLASALGASGVSSVSLFSGLGHASFRFSVLVRAAIVSARAISRLARFRLGGVLELGRGVLEAQPEQLAARGLDVLAQLGVGEVARRRRLSSHASSRITNLVRTGSL